MENTKEFKLNFKQSGVVLVIVAAFVVFRFMSVGESNDETLREAVMAELQNELASVVSDNQSLLKEGRVEEYVENVDLSNIKILKLSVSKPLLSMGSSEETVVKVAYLLPGGKTKPRIIYYRFKYSLIGGWTQGIETTSFHYYSNFIL